jgi:hypothetical protein
MKKSGIQCSPQIRLHWVIKTNLRETHNEVHYHMDKYLSDAWNNLKQMDVLSSLILHLSLGYIIGNPRKSKANLSVLCRTHQILDYVTILIYVM